MAAKSKKRLYKNENKLLKLEKLELKDVVCSICQSILIEPVTLPCYHYFCHRCFNGSIENNALCCPLCRLRIGSWLRTATKQNNLVNNELWSYIKTKFSQEIDIKLKGEDINLPEEKPVLRLSAPGEIRSEYEAELRRLKEERLHLEQKQIQETEFLIKKIQQEEQEAQEKYLERLRQDEILAQKIQEEHLKNSAPVKSAKKKPIKATVTKSRLKATTIKNYLSKIQLPPVNESPLLTDDNTSTDESTPKVSTVKPVSRASPEIVPSYGNLLKNFIDQKNKTGTSLWNKENGDKKQKLNPPSNHEELEKTANKCNEKKKNGIKSLLVSLPLPSTGIPQHKPNLLENRNLRTGSVDSMHQELCYFKPIERTTPMILNKALPLRVPCLRLDPGPQVPQKEPAPSRAQYLEGLCRLRHLSLAKNLPSAFVLALNMLRNQKVQETTSKSVVNNKSKKRTVPFAKTSPAKKDIPIKTKQSAQVNGITKLDTEKTLRRTRSMGSLKEENETTPKKAKIQERKATSERKPYLRSDSKRMNAKKRLNTPTQVSEKINNNKVNLGVNNMSSPLKNCDVKKILQEQLRIEQLIEQEKSDLELARKMDAELNGRRQPRRTAVKRQVTLNYTLRPSKKLKV